MQHTVNEMQQVNNSNLLHAFAQRKEATLEDFLNLCNQIEPKYFRVLIKKKGFKIVLVIKHKKVFFGEGKTIQEAFSVLKSKIQI